MSVVMAETVLSGYSGATSDQLSQPDVVVRIYGNTATVSFRAFALAKPRPDTLRRANPLHGDIEHLAQLARSAREDEEAGRTKKLDSLNDLA